MSNNSKSKHHQPFISIIIPVYNIEDYIKKCLDSIFCQSYTDFEVICTDDGSTDNSGKILDDYAKQYPHKLKIIHQKNAGAPIARNSALAVAKGEYIAFIDGDDYIKPDYLLHLVDGAKSTKADIVISGYYDYRPNKKLVPRHCPEKNLECSKYQALYVWGRIYNRDLIAKNNILFPKIFPDDVLFNIYVFSLNPRIAFVDYLDYYYLIRDNSETRKHHKQQSVFGDFDFQISALNTKNPNDELKRYFIIRFSIGQLLLAGAYLQPSIFEREFNRLFTFFDQQNLLKNNYLSKRPKGESFTKHLAVKIIFFINRHYLVSAFSKFYCFKNRTK